MGYTFTTLDDPSATAGTYVQGINDAGEIVGYYDDGRGMPRALLKLAKRSLPMIRLRDFELLINNLIVLFV